MDTISTVKAITVIGGGNIGTQVACVCASKGYEVTVFSSKPQSFTGELKIVNSDREVQCFGKIKLVTDKIDEAMNAKLIFVTYPASLFQKLAEKMLPYVDENTKIVCLPGIGGAEFSFRKCIEKGAALVGLQRVPAVARLVKYGETVCVEGKRGSLNLASIPNTISAGMSLFISDLFDMPCYPLPNYLCVTMTPSNPILHTTRLATMFADYSPGIVYKENPRFYGDWSDDASKCLLKCDAEHQNILRMISKLDLSSVHSLTEHYDDSDTPEKMTKKLRGIQSLQSLPSPMIKMQQGYIPDFSSRYFTADFPYGLAIIEQIADITGTKTPEIKRVMQWYRDKTGNTDRLDLIQYGVMTIEDLVLIYH